MKKLKKQNGITLIALVVSIIILLILATLALSLLAGEKSITQGAQHVRDDYNSGASIEKDSVDKMNSKLAEHLVGEEVVIGNATDIIEAGNATSYYGKYVDYKPDGVLDIGWRIFYIGKDPVNEAQGTGENNIYLIADHYVPREDIPPVDINGITVSLDAGDDSSGSRTAHFDNITQAYSRGTDDIDSDNPARNWLSQYFNVISSSSVSSNRAVAYMMDTYTWDKFGISDISKYVIGGPTLEMFAKSWNQAHSSQTFELTVDSYGYWINGDIDLTDTTNLWLPTAEYQIAEAEEMWMASVGGTDGRELYVSSGKYKSISYSTFYWGHTGFRPIVCLNSNVLLSTNNEGLTYKILAGDIGTQDSTEEIVAPQTPTLVEGDVTQTTFTLTATVENSLSASNKIEKYEFYIDGVLYDTNTTGVCNVIDRSAGGSYICKVIVYNKADMFTPSEELTVTTKVPLLVNGNATDFRTHIDAHDIASEYYGKYVTNYTPSGITDVKWRIFYVGTTPEETENNIYLIADHYVPQEELPAANGTSTLPNRGRTSYTRTAYFTNILSSYSSGTESIADANLARNWLNKYWEALNSGSNSDMNMKAVAYMLDTEIWNKFNDVNNQNENIAKYIIGGPTLEMFTTSWNDVHKEEIELIPTANADGYFINGEYKINGLKDRKYLWVPTPHYYGTEEGYSEIEAGAMWIASASQSYHEYVLISSYYGGVITAGADYAWDIGFRPIVCLNTDVELSTNNNGETYEIVGMD